MNDESNQTTFIKLDRKILDWRWYIDGNTFRLFVHLLLKANVRDKKFKDRIIKRGQVVYSLSKISAEIGLSIQQTRTALSHLILTNEITNESTANFSIITINNYDNYQKATKHTTNEQQTSNKLNNKRVTTTKEIYKKNNSSIVSKKNNARARTHARPTLTELNFYVSENGLNVNVQKFFEYYEKNNWTTKAGTPVKSWKMLLHTWNNTEVIQTDKREDNELAEKSWRDNYWDGLETF